MAGVVRDLCYINVRTARGVKSGACGCLGGVASGTDGQQASDLRNVSSVLDIPCRTRRGAARGTHTGRTYDSLSSPSPHGYILSSTVEDRTTPRSSSCGIGYSRSMMDEGTIGVSGVLCQCLPCLSNFLAWRCRFTGESSAVRIEYPREPACCGCTGALVIPPITCNGGEEFVCESSYTLSGSTQEQNIRRRL